MVTIYDIWLILVLNDEKFMFFLFWRFFAVFRLNTQGRCLLFQIFLTIDFTYIKMIVVQVNFTCLPEFDTPKQRV